MFKSKRIPASILTALVALGVLLAACSPVETPDSGVMTSPLSTDEADQIEPGSTEPVDVVPTLDEAGGSSSLATSEATVASSMDNTEVPEATLDSTGAGSTGGLGSETSTPDPIATESTAGAPAMSATISADGTAGAGTLGTTPEAPVGTSSAIGALQATPGLTMTLTPTSSATTATPRATTSSSATLTSTLQATAVGTPSTLPVTGNNDAGNAALSLLLLGLGVLLLMAVAGLAFANRPR
jgi:hypothetical protein